MASWFKQHHFHKLHPPTTPEEGRMLKHWDGNHLECRATAVLFAHVNVRVLFLFTCLVVSLEAVVWWKVCPWLCLQPTQWCSSLLALLIIHVRLGFAPHHVNLSRTLGRKFSNNQVFQFRLSTAPLCIVPRTLQSSSLRVCQYLRCCPQCFWYYLCTKLALTICRAPNTSEASDASDVSDTSQNLQPAQLRCRTAHCFDIRIIGPLVKLWMSFRSMIEQSEQSWMCYLVILVAVSSFERLHDQRVCGIHMNPIRAIWTALIHIVSFRLHVATHFAPSMLCRQPQKNITSIKPMLINKVH